MRALVLYHDYRFGTQKYIANLGHGMLPQHTPESVGIFVDEIHSYSEKVNKEKKEKQAAVAAEEPDMKKRKLAAGAE